jgi:hypothetical protein
MTQHERRTIAKVAGGAPTGGQAAVRARNWTLVSPLPFR